MLRRTWEGVSVPEHRHVDGVVGKTGDEASQRDEEHGWQEVVWAAVGTGARPDTANIVSVLDTKAATVSLNKEDETLRFRFLKISF